MDNNENEFSPQESLRLISSMIETTKNSIKDNSFYFLLWGWAVLLACVGQYYLKVVANYSNNGIVWLIIPVAFIIQVVFIIKEKKKERVRTFIGEAYTYLWTAVGLSFFVLAFIFNKAGWEYSSVFYILLYAIGTYVSGRLIKFRPLFIGGMICFPLAILTTYLAADQQLIMLALAILISYIIPGHLLRIKNRKQQSHV